MKVVAPPSRSGPSGHRGARESSPGVLRTEPGIGQGREGRSLQTKIGPAGLKTGERNLFSKAGRRWLSGLDLPLDEQLTLEGGLRQIDFLDGELRALEGVLARQALASAEIRRLMTVPGVNVHTAAAFMASVGDVGRFSSPRKLVSYLGLDPRVRQSGNEVARHGRISKARAAEARHMLGEVAWKVSRTPRPMRAFFERVRARRGAQVAATATARKLVVLFWHLLTREEDYAFARPSMTRHKLRQLELAAGAPPRKGKAGVAGSVGRRARALSRQAEIAYRRPRQRLAGARATEYGCRRDTGARISWAVCAASSAAGLEPQALRFSSSSGPAPERNPPKLEALSPAAG